MLTIGAEHNNFLTRKNMYFNKNKIIFGQKRNYLIISVAYLCDTLFLVFEKLYFGYYIN